MTEQQKKSIHESVQAAIEAGKVQMRPRWHFVAQTVLVILGVVLALFTVLYIVSFIFFALHQNGLWFAPEFGARGWRELLFSLPWVMILLVVAFLVVLEILVKRYSFGYGRPLMYSAIGIAALVIVGGFIISRTPLHKGLLLRAQEDHLPFGGPFYRDYGMQPPENVTAGTIIEITENGYRLENPRQEFYQIIILPTTRLPYGSDFAVGDNVMVIGDRTGDGIQAFGIREMGTDDFVPPPRSRQKNYEYQPQ